MQGMSLVVKEIEEYIVKTQMGFKMEPLTIDKLNKWKVMFIAELNQARIAGMAQGMKIPQSPIRKVLNELGEVDSNANS